MNRAYLELILFLVALTLGGVAVERVAIAAATVAEASYAVRVSLAGGEQ